MKRFVYSNYQLMNGHHSRKTELYETWLQESRASYTLDRCASC